MNDEKVCINVIWCFGVSLKQLNECMKAKIHT